MESVGRKVFIIGGRRGLGRALVQAWANLRPEDTIVTSSRGSGANYMCDLSREESVTELLRALDEERPFRVFCMPGGGPYGEFPQKEWKDHHWALTVTLVAPMRIAHHLLRSSYCEQILFIGSAIAETAADPRAASYCAAKHGLKGFVSTINMENSAKDVRLYSPGYMATEMLPPNAASKTGKPVADPSLVAEDCACWALAPKAAWHKMYTAEFNCD